MKINLASDHAGFQLKEAVKTYLKKRGYTIEDHGAFHYDPEDDYPDFIFACAQAVSKESAGRGIIFGGSGQGEAMAANRIKGIRAAVYYGGPGEIVLLSRRHNDSNILSLGARFLTETEALKAIDRWLETAFEGGRHRRRVKALDR